jgi:hypothetical protein
MAFIGNTPQNQSFAPAIDYFNGNGVTVTFTLSRPVASVAQMIVAIDNVIQNPSSSFTVSGNAITFSSAPLSGTNNIWVEYTSLITTYQGISQDPTVIGDIRATGGYLAEGDFGNSFVDGAILDYVTGLGRITVGDADGLAIYNGGTAARTALMTVASTGNVGIGTTSPSTKLHVEQSTTGDAFKVARGGNYLIMGGSGSGTQYVKGYEGTVAFGNAFTGNTTFLTGDTERMRIDSAGNVGIGTSSPTTKLQIAGDTKIGVTGTNGVLQLARSSDGATITNFLTDGTSGIINSAVSTTFQINTAEAMRITSDGDLALGTTTTGGSTPGKQIIYYAQNLRWGMFINETTGTATPAYAIAFGSTGTLVGRIQTTNSSTTYVTSSDYRLKENIAPMTGALAKVQQLKPVTYTWKIDGTPSQGFIAHELQAVVPECVSGEKDAVNEDDSIKPQGVDTSFLVATLTAAIQELNAKVTALEAQLEAK